MVGRFRLPYSRFQDHSRVDLRVNGPEAVLFDIPVRRPGFIDKTPCVRAMGHTCGRTVVTRGQDIPIPYDHGPDLCSVTGGALGHLPGNGHEVLMPGRPIAHAPIKSPDKNGWSVLVALLSLQGPPGEAWVAWASNALDGA